MTLVVESVMSEKRIHLDLDLIRGKDGKTTNVVMVTLGLLAIVTLGVIYFAVNLSPVGWRQERTTDLPMFVLHKSDWMSYSIFRKHMEIGFQVYQNHGKCDISNKHCL